MLIQFLLLLLSIVSYSYAPTYMDRAYMFYELVIATASIYVCYKAKEKNSNIKGQILRHSIVFLVGFVVVCFQYDIDYVLGLIEPEDVQKLIWFDYNVVCRALALNVIGLNSFLVGYHLLKRKQCKEEKIKSTFIFKKIDWLRRFIWFLILGYIITIDKAYLFNGYGKVAGMGDTAQHIGIYIQGFLTAYIVIRSYNIKKTTKNISINDYIILFKDAIIPTLVMLLLIFMSGRRTEGIRFVLVLVLSFVYITDKRIGVKKLAFPALFGTIFLTFLAFFRSGLASDASQAYDVMKESLSISPATQELAFNCSSLHIAMANIPESYPFSFGLTYLCGLLMIVPGAQSLFLRFTQLPELQQNSAYIITWLGLGNFSWGLGTSIVADIYCNFAEWGVVPIMTIWGYILRKLENATFNKCSSNPYVLGISFCFYSGLIFMNRGTLTTPLASISYILIVIYFSKRKLSVEK